MNARTRRGRAELPDLPAGVHGRLRDHYGPAVENWLHNLPSIVTNIASEWGLTVLRIHDAGWTAVLAACEREGEAYLLKVTPDQERFARELTALAHWSGRPVSAVAHECAVRGALLLSAVGGLPGGIERPRDHSRRVAIRLPELHIDRVPPAGSPVPSLRHYHKTEVRPRINERLHRLAHHLDPATARLVLAIDAEQLISTMQPVMLHADLYAENVPFDADGQPVFIDPHPMVGPAAYDWAFWCVYYTAEGFDHRLRLSHDIAAVRFDDVVRHAALLALDGYLYYLDTSDPRAKSIRDVLRLATDLLATGAQT